MVTNRLRFTNIDESASLPQESAIVGYAVVKAAKGTTAPQYISKNDKNTIYQLFGYPSSTYPGLKEILAFNELYGLWVSAPSGTIIGTGSNGLPTGATLNSYYGGTYFTTLGSLENFYHVGETALGEPSINFLIECTCGASGSPYSTGSAAPTYAATKITCLTIPNATFNEAKVNGLIISFPRTDGTTARISCTLHISDNKIQCVNPTGGAVLDIGTYTIGATTTTLEITGSTLYAYTDPFTTSIYTDLDYVSVTTRVWYNNTTLNTYMDVLSGTGKITVQWIYDITDDAVMAIYQTSPRAITGNLGVSVIDVREYLYSSVSTAFTVTSAGGVTTAGNITICGLTFNLPDNTSTETADKIAAYIASGSNAYSVALKSTLYTNGYTMTYPGTGAVFTIKTNGPQYYSATITVPAVGGVEGATFGGVDTKGSTIDNPNYNTATITYTELQYETSTYTLTTPFQISTDLNKVTTIGQNIYAETMLEGNPFIRAKVYQQFYDIAGGSTWTVPNSASLLGERAASNSLFDPLMLPTLLQGGWDLAGAAEYQDVQIAFDPESCSDITATLASLRAGALPFTTFVTGIRVANAMPTSPTELFTAVQAIIEARALLPNATGLAYYCNEFFVSETLSGTSFWSIPTGAVAKMLALIMDKKLGGVAPMFVNESGNPGLGGQISITGVKRAKFNFGADHLDMLDAAGVNPIIFDTFYGIMMTSHKTAQSPINLTDWSFLGHQMSFDMFRSAVKQGVMIPQIGKLINPYYMNLRKTQVQAILNARTTGSAAIWDSGKVLVEEVNTSETKAQNKFVIKVRVKVYPFSEYVELIFVNVGQSSSVES